MAFFKVAEFFVLLTEPCERVCVCVSPADKEELSLRCRHLPVQHVDISVAHSSLLHIFLAPRSLEGSFEVPVHKLYLQKMLRTFFFFIELLSEGPIDRTDQTFPPPFIPFYHRISSSGAYLLVLFESSALR